MLSEILKFLSANDIVLVIVVCACCILLIGIIVVFIIVLRQGREITLWHLKIGAKPPLPMSDTTSQDEKKREEIQKGDEEEKEALLETFFKHIESEGIRSIEVFKIIAKTFQSQHKNKTVLSIDNEEIIKILIKYTKKWLQQYYSKTQDVKDAEFLSGLGLITIANLSVPTDSTTLGEGIIFIDHWHDQVSNYWHLDPNEYNYIIKMLDDAKIILKENKSNFNHYTNSE